jgi:hypothetical protein
MSVELFPKDISDKKILLSPLDWGMGHTTRCVSIIRQLLAQDNSLTFAGNESQTGFMRREFSEIECVHLEGYNIFLDSKRNTYRQMMNQALKINGASKSENRWLKKYCETNDVDIIISDNRYGFYHTEIPSIFITHQLKLQIPTLAGLTSNLIQSRVNKFDCCWIPDDERNLSGELSNAKLEIPALRIGILNRFVKIETDEDLDILVILSGPEPSRTTFEKQCIDYLRKNEVGSAAIVGSGNDQHQYEMYSNPSTKEMENLIARSCLVLSRAGYTSIMEMVDLQQNAVLIPTSGQFEQEYLSEHIQISHINFQTESEAF